MRRLKLLLVLVSILFIGINVKAVNTEDKVYDFANVLTPTEKEELKTYIDEYIETYDMDMAIVTVRYHDYPSTMSYADNFYDINGFGKNATEDGLVCVIDFSTGHDDFYISTKGQAIIMYDDARIDRILDAMDDVYYRDKTDYFNMFKAFINKSSYYASMGKPASNKNVKLDDKGMPYVEYPFPWFKIGFFSVIISTIIVVVLMLKNKMVHKKTDAGDYLNKESVNITERHDQFITTHTSRVRISSSSSSGGGHAGGSSFHSSGGGFHGGGGRSH